MKDRYNSFVNTICLALVVLINANGHGAEETVPTAANSGERVYAKADLVTPYMTVVSPLKSEIQYSFSTAWQKAMENKISSDQRRLYVSKDKGETWTALCNHLNFVEVFIHPDVGILYGIIAEINVLVENNNGILSRRSVVMKLVTSADGKDWKDITRGEEHRYTRFFGLSKDPEYPARIKVGTVVDGIRTHSFILRAVDDQHSAWRREEYDLFGNDKPSETSRPPR